MLYGASKVLLVLN